jgi:hypothetical protein
MFGVNAKKAVGHLYRDVILTDFGNSGYPEYSTRSRGCLIHLISPVMQVREQVTFCRVAPGWRLKSALAADPQGVSGGPLMPGISRLFRLIKQGK